LSSIVILNMRNLGRQSHSTALFSPDGLIPNCPM
jgi:hypothetical protein